jgi:glycosyltransferase involved in cell wall biosynthesis
MTTQIQVSIGIPTYKRPELLRRSLESIFKQKYDNLEVIIGDNDFEGFDAEKVFRVYEGKFKSITYKKHARNIGPTENMMFLLSEASGPYFMWLADDDELCGENYIRTLVEMLQENPDAVTAAAQWKLMSSPDSGELQQFRDYSSRYWFLRVLKFIWRADDDFFYGLHRKEQLKKARVAEYWPINKGVVSNLTYTYLIDLVILGRILRSRDAEISWSCHAYTDKYHTVGFKKRSVDLSYILKRINVHWIYLKRILKKGGWRYLIAFSFVSALSLFGEGVNIIFTYARIRVKNLFLFKIKSR